MQILMLFFLIQAALSFALPNDIGRAPKMIISVLLALTLSVGTSPSISSLVFFARAGAYLLGMVLLLNMITFIGDLAEYARGQLLSAQYDPLLHLEESSLSSLMRYVAIGVFTLCGGIERSFAHLLSNVSEKSLFEIAKSMLVASLAPIHYFFPWLLLMVVIDVATSYCALYFKINTPAGVAVMFKGAIVLLVLQQWSFIR